jgi:hypothetical protein
MEVSSFNYIFNEPDLETELKIEKMLLERDLSYISNAIFYKKELLSKMQTYDSSYKIKFSIKNVYIRKIYLDIEFKNEMYFLEDSDLDHIISNSSFELPGKNKSSSRNNVCNISLSMAYFRHLIMKKSIYLTETKLRFELCDFNLMNITVNEINEIECWLTSINFIESIHDKFKIWINFVCEPVEKNYVYTPIFHIRRKFSQYYDYYNYLYNHNQKYFINESGYCVGIFLRLENKRSKFDPPDNLNKILFYSSENGSSEKIVFYSDALLQINYLNVKYILLIFDPNSRTEEYQSYLLSGYIPNISKLKGLHTSTFDNEFDESEVDDSESEDSYTEDIKDIKHTEDIEDAKDTKYTYYKLEFVHEKTSEMIIYDVCSQYLYIDMI